MLTSISIVATGVIVGLIGFCVIAYAVMLNPRFIEWATNHYMKAIEKAWMAESTEDEEPEE